MAAARPGALADGLSLAFRINAGIALATAGLACATLTGSLRPPAALSALRREQGAALPTRPIDA